MTRPRITVDTFARNSAERLDGPSAYFINKASRGNEDAKRNLKKLVATRTLYVGNLSFYTTEEQIHELFTKAGRIARIVMGLDRIKGTPCGFCFVEYESHRDSLHAVRYLQDTVLDDREISIDLDSGFVEGRQYGRGYFGGQIQDQDRTNDDPCRGGWGQRYYN